jgi:2-alkyl-3-oxoalkanoate reductase
MKVFVTGSTGALGRALIPQLIENGYQVTALVRTLDKGEALKEVGADIVVADPLNKDELTAAIVDAKPQVIVHELTAHACLTNFRHFDKAQALTNRFRTEVTDTLLAAARLAGARRFIAQSFCGWPFARQGGPVKKEEDPLDSHPPAQFKRSWDAIRYLEDTMAHTTDMQALTLRYGFFYGPGTAIARDGAIASLLRRRKLPIVGAGTGIWSFIHILDAARATVVAVSQGAPGIYNIVDSEPVPVSAWLPLLAQVLGAPAPRTQPKWIARWVIGENGVVVMTEVRGGSNSKAVSGLGWQPMFTNYRQGFLKGL